MLKKLVVLAFIFIFSSTQTAFSQVEETAFEVTLPSENIVQMTKSQLEELLSKPGIGFANKPPSKNLPEDQIAIPLPPELGGGYLLGTPEAIAKALNAVEVTVGATAAYVTGSKIKIRIILLFTTLIGGIIALALGGEGAAPPSH